MSIVYISALIWQDILQLFFSIHTFDKVKHVIDIIIINWGYFNILLTLILIYLTQLKQIIFSQHTFDNIIQINVKSS